MGEIFDKLIKYCGEDYVPMHMPGHKRNTEEYVMGNPFGFDITEIDGFDNLHNPSGIIMDSMNRTAKMYAADHTFYLVNGSSAGLLAAISATAKRGSKIIVARNSHKSIYNAIYLNELNPIYVYPENTNALGINGSISADSVHRLLNENSDVAAVIITSPTYEGITSDINEIAKIVHKYGIPLIVDEAHGAHFAFHEVFPNSAVECGADIVVQSIHKTLPAFTQTALMHVKGEIVDIERIKRYWDMYQSTSPSYILLAGIDNCMSMIRENGTEMFENYISNLNRLRDDIRKLKNIGLHETDDISKIVLFYKNADLNGKQFYDILLEKYHIQLEMASLKYVIAMTSVGDRTEYYNKFIEALRDIDAGVYNCNKAADISGNKEFVSRLLKKNNSFEINRFGSVRAEVVLAPYYAMNAESELVDLKKAAGRISACSICIYPPGIPVIFPGEIITDVIIEYIRSAFDVGLEVIGTEEVICLSEVTEEKCPELNESEPNESELNESEKSGLEISGSEPMKCDRIGEHQEYRMYKFDKTDKADMSEKAEMSDKAETFDKADTLDIADLEDRKDKADFEMGVAIRCMK